MNDYKCTPNTKTNVNLLKSPNFVFMNKVFFDKVFLMADVFAVIPTERNGIKFKKPKEEN